MRTSFTFFRKVARGFLGWFLTISASFSFILFLFTLLEFSRRAHNKSHVGMAQMMLLALYQLPELLLQLLPFLVLFSTMIFLWQMNKRLELVVARSLGFSIWPILWSIWTVLLGFSFLQFTVLSPVSAEFSSRFSQMEKDLFNGGSSLLMVSESGLWLKQESNTTYSLIRVARVDGAKDVLHDVSVYSFDLFNHFINRLDANQVEIQPHGWRLKNTWLSEFNKPSVLVGDVLWKTDLTVLKIQKSFSKPSNVSLWRLPSLIRLMEEAGLSTLEHKHYLYTNLLQPFLLMVMAMVAGLCAYHFTRRKGGAHFIITGLMSGFLVFFIQRMSHALGLSMSIPLFFSVLLPILVGALGSIALLIHLEEGK